MNMGETMELRDSVLSTHVRFFFFNIVLINMSTWLWSRQRPHTIFTFTNSITWACIVISLEGLCVQMLWLDSIWMCKIILFMRGADKSELKGCGYAVGILGLMLKDIIECQKGSPWKWNITFSVKFLRTN